MTKKKIIISAILAAFILVSTGLGVFMIVNENKLESAQTAILQELNSNSSRYETTKLGIVNCDKSKAEEIAKAVGGKITDSTDSDYKYLLTLSNRKTVKSVLENDANRKYLKFMTMIRK